MNRLGRTFKAVCLVLISCILVWSCFNLLGDHSIRALAAPDLTFLVNSIAETPDANPGNGICADPGGNCSLRAAVQEANAWAGADIITLPANTYTLALSISVTQDLTINGAGRLTTIITGAGSSGATGFNVSPDYDLTLNNLTLRNFPKAVYIAGSEANQGVVTLTGCNLRDNLNTDTNNAGSAVANYCEGCTVNLNDVKVYDNSSPSCGAISSHGALSIGAGSLIYDNQATTSVGGAICNDGGTLSVMLSSIYSNQASGASNNFGGAIYQSDGSTALYQGQVYGNSASDMGGAIYIGDGSLFLDYSSISGNSAISGGGLLLNPSTTAEIDTSIIANNDASYGGGIYNMKGLTIENSAIVSNTATSDGAGIYAQNGTLILLNSTVSGNQANRDGGGIMTKNASVVKLGSVTVSNNTADANPDGVGWGGGVYEGGDNGVTIKNTIIAGNQDLAASLVEIYNPDCFGAFISEGYNLIGKVNSFNCSVSGNLSGVVLGSLSPGIDARLSPLTLDLYSTYHHPLLFGLAVDRGNPSGCKDFSNVNLLHDQRGELRIFGVGDPTYSARCDLGAVESSLARYDIFLAIVIR